MPEKPPTQAQGRLHPIARCCPVGGCAGAVRASEALRRGMPHSTSWLRCCMQCTNTFTGDRRVAQEGDLASARSQYQLAISQLKAADEASRPILLARLAGCHHRLSDAAGALECYEELLQLPAAGAHRNSSMINSAELLRQVHAVLAVLGCGGCACVGDVLYILLCLRTGCAVCVCFLYWVRSISYCAGCTFLLPTTHLDTVMAVAVVQTRPSSTAPAASSTSSPPSSIGGSCKHQPLSSANRLWSARRSCHCDSERHPHPSHCRWPFSTCSHSIEARAARAGLGALATCSHYGRVVPRCLCDSRRCAETVGDVGGGAPMYQSR